MVQSHHDSVGPGAVEDASGSAEVIALAEHYGRLAAQGAVREKTLGKHHIEVATSLNNLAALHHVRNRPADAVPLLRRALTILAKQLPAGHPKLKLYQKNYDELRKRLEKERRRLESG